MLPRCRTADEPFMIPPFDVQVSDVEGFMDELQAFQSVFHDCFARSEARGHFLDYMVGQYSPLARKSIEPMALAVEGSRIRSLQRFLSETVWDEEQMRWNYHQLVADELGEPDGVLMFDESGFVKKGKAIGPNSRGQLLPLRVGFREPVILHPVAVAVTPGWLHVGPQPRRGNDGEAVQRVAHRFPDQFKPVEGPDRREDMRRICPLRPPCFEEVAFL